MSKLFKLDLKDVLNGFFTSVFGGVTIYLLGVFYALYQAVNNNEPFKIHVNFEAVLVIAIFSGLSYLVKRFFSGENGTILK